MKNKIFSIIRISKSQIKIKYQKHFKLKIFKISKIKNSQYGRIMRMKFYQNQVKKDKKIKIRQLHLQIKTLYQCSFRFKKINPNIKKGRWTENEDGKVLYLVNLLGKSWKSLAKIIKNRTNK